LLAVSKFSGRAQSQESERQRLQRCALHFLAHLDAIAKKQAANAPGPPQKPVSVSVNYKDIPDPNEADQVLSKAAFK